MESKTGIVTKAKDVIKTAKEYWNENVWCI